MVEAVEKAGVPNMVWYNYRRVPAVTLAKQLIDEGRLGRIFHYRAKFLQDWTISADLPQGGDGPLAARRRRRRQRRHRRPARPLHRHGPLAQRRRSTEVTAMTETFIKERKHNLTGKVEPVGIDDACAFLCRFENGSLATFESTRYARGHKALYTFEINGEHASIVLGPARPASPAVLRSPRRRHASAAGASIHVTDGDHPYMKHWWVPGLQIGYEHTFIHQFADFLQAVGAGKSRARRRSATGSRPITSPMPCSKSAKSTTVGSGVARGRVSADEVSNDDEPRRRTRHRGVVVARRPARAGAASAAAAARCGASSRQRAAQRCRRRAVARRGRRRRARPAAIPFEDHAGFKPIFDGTTLKGWDGDPAFWRSKAARIVGQSTADNPVKQNTFLIWRGGEPADFELKVEFRINTTNSGIQYPQRAAAGQTRNRRSASGC